MSRHRKHRSTSVEGAQVESLTSGVSLNQNPKNLSSIGLLPVNRLNIGDNLQVHHVRSSTQTRYTQKSKSKIKNKQQHSLLDFVPFPMGNATVTLKDPLSLNHQNSKLSTSFHSQNTNNLCPSWKTLNALFSSIPCSRPHSTSTLSTNSSRIFAV